MFNQYTNSSDTLLIGNSENVPFSTQTILIEAKKLGIDIKEIPGTKTFKLQYKDKVKYLKDQLAPDNTAIGYLSCQDKVATKAYLTSQGISVAKGVLLKKVPTISDFEELQKKLNGPYIIKPTHGQHGTQVYTNISDFKTVTEKAALILENSSSEEGALIEEMFVGNEYRVLVTKEKVIGIINRVPANVIGNGINTIKELIEIKNQDPRRGDGYEKALLKIIIDDVVIDFLNKQNLTLDSIPTESEQVFLRQNSNLSTGGDSIDVTDIAHESVKNIAVTAMNTIPGLFLAGLDFMTQDITQPQTTNSYIVVEVNASPMLTMHDYPYEGIKRNAAQEVLLMSFPEIKL